MRKTRKTKSFLPVIFIISLLLTGLIIYYYLANLTNKNTPLLPNPLATESQNVLLLKTSLSEANLEIVSGPKLTNDSSDIEVTISPNIKVIFPSKEDVVQKVITLQLILNKSKIDNQQENDYPKVIDLRTNKPHVTF
jgi:hypothetical protein